MRILINDFGGYPFPIQLSKFLANKGYEIAHTYVSNIATPHGNMENEEDSKLKIFPMMLNTEFKKYSVIGRFKGEFEYAKKVSKLLKSYKPDIFVSANTPLFAQSILLKECKKLNVKFIYWCQDIHSIAIEGYLTKKISWPGKIVAAYFKRKEIKLLENSDYVITITQGFNDVFKKWGLSQSKMSVIHNWGPIDEITVEPKTNPWSEKLQIDNKRIVMYSGTLGVKHNPQLIIDAAKHFISNGTLLFIVISEGIGADILKQQNLNNLMVLPYQDYSELPDVLGSADILLSILEPNASSFSVPSKVLTYLCAKKPIILSVPHNNLSAKIVLDTEAGLCIKPGDTEGFINAIANLMNDDLLRIQMGKNGRKYAIDNFRIEIIAQKFLEIFKSI
jgi:colanic acid biosynthesis glycosyl transferase WcaI